MALIYTKLTHIFYEKSSTNPEADKIVYQMLLDEDLKGAYEHADDYLEQCLAGDNQARTCAAMITASLALLSWNGRKQAVAGALSLATDAFTLAEKMGDVTLMIQAIVMESKCLMFTDGSMASSERATLAWKMASEIDNKYLRMLAIANLMATYPRTAETIDSFHRKASEWAGEIISLFPDSSDALGQGCAFVLISKFLAKAEDLHGALKCAKDAAALFTKIGDVEMQATATLYACQAAMKSSELPSEATALGDKAIKLFREAGASKEAIPLKLSLAEYRLQNDEYIPAEDLAEDAVKAGRELKDVRLTAEALRVLATIRLAIAVADQQDNKDDIDTRTATEAACESVALYRKVKFQHGEGKATYKLAQIRYYSGAYETAICGAEVAQGCFSAVGDIENEADAMLLAGIVLQAQENYEKAKRQAKKALTLFERVGSNAGVDRVNEFMERIQEAQSAKKRQKQEEKKKEGSVTKAGFVKLVNNADEAQHLLSYFADVNDEEDTELTEFDLSAWTQPESAQPVPVQ